MRQSNRSFSLPTKCFELIMSIDLTFSTCSCITYSLYVLSVYLVRVDQSVFSASPDLLVIGQHWPERREARRRILQTWARWWLPRPVAAPALPPTRTGSWAEVRRTCEEVRRRLESMSTQLPTEAPLFQAQQTLAHL